TGPALWMSDGTTGGTQLVRAFPKGHSTGPTITELTAVNDQLYFAGYTQNAGLELWTSNGTAAGTHLVKDIKPGGYHVGLEPFLTPNSYAPAYLTAFDGKVYFVAEDAAHGRELWASDGTAAGTHLVLDVIAGAAGGLANTSGLSATAEGVYFSATDNVHGVE